VDCLVSLQHDGAGGGWPGQAVSGVFFQTAILDYRLYKAIIPAWAIAAVQQELSDRAR
jgi:lanosterol synthase